METLILITEKNDMKEMVKKMNKLTDTVFVFGAVDDNANSALHLAAMFTDHRPWLALDAALQM